MTRYDSRKICIFLSEAFDINELKFFCYDFYPSIYGDVIRDSLTTSVAQQLINYATQNNSLTELLQQAKSHKPDTYELYAPYTLPKPTTSPQILTSQHDNDIQQTANLENSTVIGCGNAVNISIVAGVSSALLIILVLIGIWNGSVQTAGVYLALQPTPTPTITQTPTPPPTVTPTFTPTPAIMQGDFNIAVAEFQVTGNGDGLTEAEDLAQSFSNAIDRELNTLVDEIDLSIEVRPPLETGLVAGSTDSERAEIAHNLADEIKADVVIYGVIEVDGISASVKPEFYIKSEDETAVGDTTEVVGQYHMGKPVTTDKVDSRSEQRRVSGVLADRFRALAFVIYGVSDYIIGEYETAEANFNQALEIKAWNNPDVIYVMLGNSALRQEDMSKAEQYYQQAAEINPIYSRAYAGLGSVYHRLAVGDTGTNTYDDVDMTMLNQAITTYQQALAPEMDNPSLADVDSKVNYGIGQSYLLKATISASQGDKTTSQQSLQAALQAFEAVITEYHDQGNPRVQELAAHTHARLGLVYRLVNQPEQAITEYQQALDLLPPLNKNQRYQAVYEAIIGDIYLYLEQPELARDWYKRAVQSAPDGSAEVKQFQSKLDSLP